MIQSEKQVYKDSFDQLRRLKTEIETIQRMLEAGRVKLQKDFDAWSSYARRSRPAATPAFCGPSRGHRQSNAASTIEDTGSRTPIRR